MSPMKRIVVPTDFSNLSRSAALYAIDLAAKTHARVMIVSVMFIHKIGLFEKLFKKSHTREMALRSQVPLLSMKKAG